MKKTFVILAMVLSLLILAGCNIRNNAPVRPLESPRATTGSPASSRNPGYATVAPDKTASQDTAGAATRLPEAATAEGATTMP